MKTDTTNPQAPLSADEVKAIFSGTFAEEMDKHAADKKRRNLKNQKLTQKEITKATNVARHEVIKAQFAERVRRQDPNDPLTSDKNWNPDHKELLEERGELDELATWLEAQTWSDFALDVAKFYRKNGRLSEKQIAAARGMKEKVEANAARKAQAAEVEEIQAAQGLDLSGLPNGRYGVPGSDGRLKVRIEHGKENGRWAGWIFVKDAAEYGMGKRYGMQKPDQGYVGDIRDQLEAILADPKAALAEYGLLTGSCGVCGRELEDEESVRLGIGPICRSKSILW